MDTKGRKARPANVPISICTRHDIAEIAVLITIILFGMTLLQNVTATPSQNKQSKLAWLSVFSWGNSNNTLDKENVAQNYLIWNNIKRPSSRTKMIKNSENNSVDDMTLKGTENDAIGIDNSARAVRAKQCDVIPDSHKFDCHPEGFPTGVVCLRRGCCWSNSGPKSDELHMSAPSCYYPMNYDGYKVSGKPTNSTIGINLSFKRTSETYYPNTVMNLEVDIEYQTDYRLRVKITDPTTKRWEVPLAHPTSSPRSVTSDNLYTVEISDQGQPFSLEVKRSSSNTPLIRTAGAFMYNDQFLQLSSFLPSTRIYGLGEHRSSLQLNINWTKFVMWNHGDPPQENANLYGSHPFYLMMENDTNSHGVFLLNSNAIEVELQPAPAITWRTIGGILDFYIFLGPTPSDVIRQYTEIIGRSFLPPYWSLGFHQSRWGYFTANQTQAIADKLTKAGMPHDTQWNDLDYMDGRKDFTTSEKFGDQKKLADTLHAQGKHYMIIVDPGISNSEKGYGPYDLGKSLGIFINDSSGKPLVGVVWPGTVVFPDFTNPQAPYYWSTIVKSFQFKVPFDGLWIDMNEIDNLITGSVTGCPLDDRYEHPPYVPRLREGKLRSRTTCASGRQYLSSSYNLHNLYGLGEAMASHTALLTARPGKRPFIISRATFAGQGQFGGHWSGDNAATYYDMYKSVSEVLSFNMFGMPMVGADICGFRQPTTEELCQRWFQLGAFYPFSRSHNNILMPDQDPTAFSPALLNSTRDVYLTRYSFLPYLYTLFYRSHVNGDTVARPIFIEFPNDHWALDIDTHFLWGPALMIVPVLQKNTTRVCAYFPQTTWFYWPTGSRMTDTGGTFCLPAPLNRINLNIRAGYIIPMQKPGLTTTQSRKKNFWLLVALTRSLEAEGELYWDDGDSYGTYEQGNFNTFKFIAKNNTVTSELDHLGYTSEPMTLGNVTVLGVLSKPKTVTINGETTPFDYDQRHEVLKVTQFTEDMLKPFEMTWTL